MPWHRRPAVRLSAAAAATFGLLFTAQAAGLNSIARAADEPQSAVSITKTNNLDGKPLQPGDDFIYTLTGQCSGLTVDCVHFTVTDTLPAEFDVTSLPQSNASRDVTYDAATRKLTVVYKQALQNPAGETGLRAGQSGSIEIGMRLPADTQEKDGTVVPNSAEVTADNADPKKSTTDVTIAIPRVVKPVATKSWADGSAVAGSGEESVLTLGVRNNSSSSADVTQLTISDENQDTFEYFDYESAKVTAFPAGADQAHLVVTTADGTTHTGATITAPGPLPLPDGVEPGQVTGFEVVFTNSSGDPLPYDTTGGTVEVTLKLRDTKRSDGSPLRPTDKVTVGNCATPSALEKTEGAVQGEQACASYDILPDILNLNATKAFFPDTNGDYAHQSAEHAVVGENSPVTGLIDVTNESPFPVKSMTVTEPAPGEASDFDKIDVQQVRLRFPEGATEATLTVTYADGTSTTTKYTENTTVDVAKAGTTVTRVSVTYTGVDADGNPTIKENADAGLDIHGTLVDGVTAGSLTNCARFTGDAGRTDGSGTAAGHVCQDLQVEDPHTSGSGSKTVDQTDIPIGQPIPMHLNITNNGNTPLVNPVITDPTAKADGTPDLTNNPFDYLQIDSITIDPSTTDASIELWDPEADGGQGGWVPYDASDTALLHRAKGFRVTYHGDLPPEGHFTINLVTERREGTPDGASFTNCFSISADGGYHPDTPSCSAGMNTGPAEDSASINKSISPGELPEYVPGLPRQHADATLRIRNTGNMSAKTLTMTDQDADFFDAVDLVSIKSNQLPAGADRVRIDAYVNGAWVTGTPAATAALPAGVNAADVTGIRAVYSSTSSFNDGYTITPCKDTGCDGILVLDVSPRPALRSSGGPVPSHLEDTLAGSFLTKLETDGVPAVIKPVKATLDLVKGTPRLAVNKTPNTVLSPGEDAPFYLKVANTGTANIPDLVVKDDLPPGIAFNSTFQGDGGQPYKIIDESVPAGTPAVPTPVFTQTNSGSRVSGLTWNFAKDDAGKPWVLAPGATFTIEIHVTLEPGIHAGDVVTNTMGATSSDPDTVCEDTEHQQVDGDMFGAGTYCTSSATLTAKSGAAFTARKWVSGNDSLGWYNAGSKKIVPVGDATCLSTTGPDGRTYTANPCIALVNPGDRYHYLMRLQNAGTEPGTAMRIVDRFPVQGDRGVIVDQARGTAWDQRPLLASRPSLDGVGDMQVSYSNSEPLCTDDLDMGGAGSSAPQCAAGTWDDPYSSKALGMRLELTFPTPLPPGGTEQITWAMDTPLDVAHNGDPTIAWNSYAHNETTDRSGSTATVTPPAVSAPKRLPGARAAADPRVLQPNEPIQVGVALAYGELRLVKRLGKHPEQLDGALRRMPFRYHVTCTIHPQGHLPRTVVDRDYWVSANKPVTIDGIPAGATCEVWEVGARGGATDHPEDNPVTVTIEPRLGTETVQRAAITNTFEFGHLELKKALAGDAASYAADRTFSATVSCALPDGSGGASDLVLHRTYRVTAGKPVTIGPLPVNTRCWAEEVDTGGAAQAVVDHGSPDNPVVVTADATGTAVITITNTFPAGRLTVTKHVVNGAAGPYTFALACTTAAGDVPLAAGDRAFELEDGESRTVTVPAGAHCTVQERKAPAGDTVSYASSPGGGTDGAVTVSGAASVTVTNTFPVQPGPGPHRPGHAAPGGGGLARTGLGDWTTVGAVLALITLVGGAGVWLMARRRRA